MLDVIRTGDVVDVDFPNLSRTATEYAPRHVVVPVVFVGDEGVGKNALRLDHANAAAKTTGAGHNIVA